jgi:beta-galactosidase GanA
MKRSPHRPPYLGAAYYPEDWPLEQIDEDIRLMKEAGMNVMRIGEFAWSRMEPNEGRYDFAWLHLVVDRLGKAGIATIMGTPTATPPIWLTEKHPEILYQMDNGREIPHGGRRHYCPNSPVYRRYVHAIVTKMAKEFGRDTNVIGWQIDNEVSYYGRPCVCTVCRTKFRESMKERFGTIRKLNEAWCTDLWSQTYQSFEQLPIPRRDIWHHPSLLQAWSEFGSNSYVEFVTFQADILHAAVSQPVGTDMMSTGAVDYVDMHRSLDIVQYNHYDGQETVWCAAFWFDFIRTLKDVPFWNTETATCWNGSTAANGYKAPGFCRVNSWMPVLMGGEANLYWLWRQHWAGQELMHGAVVSSAGRPLHMIDEVREISAGFAAAADFLNGTRPTPSGLALHFSNRTQALFGHQPMVNGMKYPWKSLQDAVYRPLIEAQWRPDIYEPAQDFSSARLMISAFLPMLDESGLRERLRDWIENGGIWVAGPLTDVRDLNGCKYRHSPYGTLEEWAGVRSRFEIPGDPRDFRFAFSDGSRARGSHWYDAMDLRGARAVAKYTEGPMKGRAAIAENAMGKGRIVVLGTMPEPKALKKLVASVARRAGVKPAAVASANLLVVPRSGKGGEGLGVAEVRNKAAWLRLTRRAVDLTTGRKQQAGVVKIKPFQVMVLKYV